MYVVHIRSLKQALNHRLMLQKKHRVVQFNQEAWVKPYIEMKQNWQHNQKLILKRISFS